MRKLETLDWWPDLLRQKDSLSLKQLAEKFNVTPGAISAALRRTGTSRKPASLAPEDDELPPEAGEESMPAARPPEPSRPRASKPVDEPQVAARHARRDHAWQVIFRTGAQDRIRVVVAPTVVDAADLAARAGGDEVVGLSFIGEILQ